MAVFLPLLGTTAADYRAAALEGQRFLHSGGITGWHDALLGGYAGIDDPTAAWLDFIGSGRLTGRVHGALWWDREQGTEQLPALGERTRELTRAGLACQTVMLMMG